MTHETIIARRRGDELVFLCTRCGHIHRHGVGNGHRASHCPKDRGGEYFLQEDVDAVYGELTDDELHPAHEILHSARRGIHSVAEYLGDAGFLEDAGKLSVLVDVLAVYVDYSADKTCRLEELAGVVLQEDVAQ
ncbi:hypothetical protein [Primorskyibacter sp. S87]|uniref:hypothetical protein n=1 Tax=Primorskyibacter sp. S87 TaxID=3415126 RepID=UPI003C7DC376